MTYEAGKRVGDETYLDAEGNKVWMWKHEADGTGIWAQYYPNGKKTWESMWRDLRAEGQAKRLNSGVRLISHSRFVDVRLP